LHAAIGWGGLAVRHAGSQVPTKPRQRKRQPCPV
jgi:hypothetical protein